MSSTLLLNHPWREPLQTARELRDDDDRLVRACIPDLLAFSTTRPLDPDITALLLSDADGVVLGAWTVAGALKLAEMLRQTSPELAGEISARF